MEKSIQPVAPGRRILITGPESTGKSALASALATHFKGTVVPEYAREYMLKLKRHYVYEDVEHIALHQSKAYDRSEMKSEWVFFDTWLIITKVWFEVVYGKVPHWIDERIRKAHFDLVLVCDTDIPWIPDPVRENGGQRREKLMDRYRKELEQYGLEWCLVSGTGKERTRRAVQIIHEHFTHGTN
jgi:NadR type nicotinamide-nucleotide adenylyltransferase